MGIQLFEVSPKYINYLLPYAPHLFHNKKAGQHNVNYKSLLMAEYRIIRVRQDLIRKNAATLYKHKLENGDATRLAKRCNDFQKLEEVCKKYIP